MGVDRCARCGCAGWLTGFRRSWGWTSGPPRRRRPLVGLDGRLLGLGRAGYPTDLGPDGRAEQDPRDWWAAIAAASRAAPAVGSPDAGSPDDRRQVEILAICCVAQGPTLVAVDAAGEPVRPAITWQDRRAGGTGFGLLPKMAWLAREDPEAAARAAWLLPAWDAVGLWLTGEAASSLQGHETVPVEAELAVAGVRASQLPAGTAVRVAPGRRSRPAAAGAWGCPPGSR